MLEQDFSEDIKDLYADTMNEMSECYYCNMETISCALDMYCELNFEVKKKANDGKNIGQMLSFMLYTYLPDYVFD